MLIALLAFVGKLGIYSLFIVFALGLQLIFSIGLSWFLASLNVLIRDISQLIPVLTVVLMLVSPIGYTEDMIPANLKLFMYFNPLYYLISLYREPLVFNRLPPFQNLFVLSIVAIGLFLLGYHVFSRLKEIFPDYV